MESMGGDFGSAAKGSAIDLEITLFLTMCNSLPCLSGVINISICTGVSKAESVQNQATKW